jgi:hypothetical protein
MIYESAAITDYWQESGGREWRGEPLPAHQPEVVASIRVGAESIQQQSKGGTSTKGNAIARES